jgi:hypothetical protein
LPDIRRIDERELFYLTQAVGQHLQDDFGEIGALDLGVGKNGAVAELFLGKQTNGNARSDAAAPA